MKKGWTSLQFQLTVYLVGLVILISGVLTAVQFFRYKADLDKDLRKNLLNQVTIGALSIDGDAHQKITAETGISSPEYLTVITPMKKFQEVNPDLYYVYTVKPDGQGGWKFIADTSDDPSLIESPIEDLSQILAENSGGFETPAVESEYYTDEWGTWLTGYAPIRDKAGDIVAYLAFDIAQSTITEKTNRLLLISGLIFLASLPVAFLFGWLISRAIIKPILKVSRLARSLAETDLPVLASACDQLAAGNLDQHYQMISTAVDYHSNSELGEMADQLNNMIHHLEQVEESFNRMSGSFSGVIRMFVKQSATLNDSAMQMEVMSKMITEEVSQIHAAASTVENGSLHQNTSVIETQERLGKMTDSISQVARGAGEQTEAVENTSKVMDGLSRVIETVVQNSNTQAETARSSTETVRKSASTVDSAVKNLKNIRVIIDQSSEKMREMGEQTRQIDAILATIDEIASQTNLLSLNAAIEAARAGEHGKGFSIVADEVRKLAEKSAGAAKEISTLVSRIEKAADEASTAMLGSRKEVESGVLLGEEAGRALDEILDSVQQSQNSGEQISQEANKMVNFADKLTESLNQVSSIAESYRGAVDEISDHIETIRGSMDQVTSICEENTGSMESVTTDIQNINLGMEELSTTSSQLSVLSVSLKDTLERFRLSENSAES